MTFAEFVSAVTRQVFPQGEAPNLKAVHKNWIKDALIELQQRVFCLQAKQFDYIIQGATFWNCGCSVFDAPRGFILGLKTISVDNICDEVRYMPSTRDEIECLVRERESDPPLLSSCGCSTAQDQPYQYCEPYPTYAYLLGMRYANPTNDLPCRARSGVFALHDNFIWMHPAMRSDEIAVLDWRGIKRSWNDLDPVEYDREVQKAVELSLESEAARKEDCDLQRYAVAKQVYADKVADLIWQCRKERRLPAQAPCFQNCECRHRCTGKPVTSLVCPPGNKYFFGSDDPNGVVQPGQKGDLYVQVLSTGQSFIWTSADGTIAGWI